MFVGLVGLLMPAWALDGTGAGPLPGEGAVTDPVVVVHPVRPVAGDGTVSLLVELASRPLVLAVEDAGEASEEDVIGGLFGFTLLGSAGLGERVQIGLAMPFWFGARGIGGTGPALGDLRLQAPVALVRPGGGGAGLGVSVVPWIDAPTGNAARYLGRGAFGGGALGVVGYGGGPVRASLNVGVAGSAETPDLGIDERLRFTMGGAVSYQPVEALGLTAEVDLQKPRVGALAGEARLSGRGRLASGIELSAGVATAVARGAGSAAWRVYAGVGYRFGKRTAPTAAPSAAVEAPLGPYDLAVSLTDEAGQPLAGVTVRATRGDDVRTGVTSATGEGRLALEPGEWSLVLEAEGREVQRRTLLLDADRFRAATVEAVLPVDEPGEAQLALLFTDAEGRPVEDARVAVDGRARGVTGPGGSFAIAGLTAGERQVAVEAPGFNASPAVYVPATADLAVRTVVLDRPAGSVKLRVRGPEGVVPDALVRLVGPTESSTSPVGPTGERDLVLTPGVWQVVVSSEAWGLQTREVVIEREARELVVVDVLLVAAERGDASLALRVIDPEGLPVDGAEVSLDGVALGRTSNGGTLALDGLETGPRLLEVHGTRFRALPAQTIELVPGGRDWLARLEWLPGSVRVVATGPDGPVPDAVVRFAGPSILVPAALGPDGRGDFTLPAGDWVAALSSPAYGLQSREVRIAEDQRSLVLVEVVMRTAEAGDAALVVRVRDPDGAPVDGATVTVDGLVVGTTSTGGSLRLEGLQPGRRTVRVSADLCEDATLPAVALGAGENEATARLAWVPGTVRVRARDADGAGVDALTRFYGTEARPPVRLGPDGERSFSLAPGPWTAVASSETYGVAQRDLAVVPGAAATNTVDFAFTPRVATDATLLVEVVDPEGNPVAGARLRMGDLDHTLVGGVIVFDALPTGTRSGSVEAEGYEPLRLPKLSLVAGPQERRFVLRPIPRPVRVVVRGPDGKPLAAQVRLVGRTAMEPMATTAGGTAEARLLPGSWQVLVSAEGVGAERQDVVVPPGTSPLTIEVSLAASRVEVTETAVLLRQQVRFRFNEAALTPESYRVLDELAVTLRTDAGVGRIEVQGHTDAVGSEAYNVALSQRRADAVRDYLVARGVARERLVARGYGTSRAQAPNDAEAGRSRNRRVQFEVLPAE
ncbi:MAG: carboxypeptidase regulatory-like domain-containing protein [Pseudomonadota bacterium]|nr:carboxypeptidase regulatory-like domain-containing protein [Pseudomonadota bacterium]